MSARGRMAGFAVPTVALALYLGAAANPDVLERVLRAVFPDEGRVLFQVPMLELIGVHVSMVALSSVLAIVIGVGLGVFVTRPAGADFLEVVTDLGNLGQTFPPIAVFTLAVPFLGFGFEPTVLALTLYSILPILANTIAGLEGVAPDVLESAAGMGMRPLQRLWRVELPLAMPVIVTGIRVSVVINVSTATIGAIAGAGGLGAPIISGLVNQDPGVTMQGAMLAAGLALIVDAYLGAVERVLTPRAAAVRAAEAVAA